MDFSKYLTSKNKIQEKQQAIETLEKEIATATAFIKEIEKGQLDAAYPDIDEKNIASNSLPGALISMKNRLKELNEGEEQRKWVTEGLAFFGDILRNNQQDLEVACNQIIRNLVKYVGVNQGAIYVVDTDEECLEQKACYAYDRKKYIEKRIGFGQGLVGQIYLEKETQVLEEVPPNYINITSGLGDAPPNTLAIVPLKINEAVLGIVELASFKKFEEYQIEFLEKLGEAIASMLSNIQTNEKTQSLLIQSQDQAAAMTAQEEELRQNMEELTSTQEEMQRVIKEVQNSERFMIDLINSTSDMIYTVDKKLELLNYNKTFQNTWEAKGLDVKKGAQISLFHNDGEEWKQNKSLIEKAFTGEHFVKEISREEGDKVSYYSINYNPILNQDGERIAVAVFSKDISEIKHTEKLLQEKIDQVKQKEEELQNQLANTSMLNLELDARMAVLNESTILSEADIYGNITFVNDKFCEVSQYKREELIGNPHKMVRHPDTPKLFFKKFWSAIKAGQVFRGYLKNRKKDGSPYYVDAVISPVLDENGKPIKYIAARYVIENETLGEELLKEQELIHLSS